MKVTAIRTKEQGGLCGHIIFYDETNQIFWAYCTGNVIKYQIPIEDFLVKVLDATASYTGDDETQTVIDAVQRRRSLNKAS